MDELIELVVNADTRPELATHVRALDRVLLHGHYLRPQLVPGQVSRRLLGQVRHPRDRAEVRSMPAGPVPAWWIRRRAEAASVAKRKEQIEKP